MDILLSFSMISRSLGDDDTLFSPSNANPPDMEPSPITATTCRLWLWSATAIPSAADMLLDACPQVNVSYMLSSGHGKGCRPFSLRLVENTSRLPVSIL